MVDAITLSQDGVTSLALLDEGYRTTVIENNEVKLRRNKGVIMSYCIFVKFTF